MFRIVLMLSAVIIVICSLLAGLPKRTVAKKLFVIPRTPGFIIMTLVILVAIARVSMLIIDHLVPTIAFCVLAILFIAYLSFELFFFGGRKC
jgi:hypothetical protein